MKFALLSLIAATAAVVAAAPSGERRAIQFGEGGDLEARSLEKRWSRYAGVAEQDPAAKRDLEDRGSFKYAGVAEQDPAAKRDLEDRGSFKYAGVAKQDPAAKRDLEERQTWGRFAGVGEEDPSA